MRAVTAAIAVDDGTFDAALRPASLAVAAVSATVVVMVHDPLADPGLALGNGGTDFGNDATWLMAGNHHGCFGNGIGSSAICSEIRPAHPGCLDFQDDLARAGCRIREVP